MHSLRWIPSKVALVHNTIQLYLNCVENQKMFISARLLSNSTLGAALSILEKNRIVLSCSLWLHIVHLMCWMLVKCNTILGHRLSVFLGKCNTLNSNSFEVISILWRWRLWLNYNVKHKMCIESGDGSWRRLECLAWTKFISQNFN